MKIEKIKNITKEKAVLCLYDDPVPLAFFNFYEEGDAWLKIKDCTDCPIESRKRCCGTCPMFSEKGCFFHLQSKTASNKPFVCVVCPSVTDNHSYCQLEFQCIKGPQKGKIRKLSEPNNVFHN